MANQTTQTDPVTVANYDAATLLKDEIALVNHVYDIAIKFFANYSFQLIGAFIIFLVGYYLSGKVAKWVLVLCDKNNLDITLSRFIANASKMLIIILIVIICLGKLGVSVTPFIATIGALSLGAGLALQGLLSNYAAGFNIIIVRPFVVGDTLTVQGVTGIVKEVLLAYTILVDEDGVRITIPNKHIVGEVLQNSQQDSLLELSVGISYDHNPLEVIDMLTPVITDLHMISEDKNPLLGINEFADSAITIGIRLWVPTENLYASKYHAYAEIYKALEQADIKIPYPQADIHLIKAD